MFLCAEAILMSTYNLCFYGEPLIMTKYPPYLLYWIQIHLLEG